MTTSPFSKIFSGLEIQGFGKIFQIQDNSITPHFTVLSVNTRSRVISIKGELIVDTFTFPTPLSIGNPPTLDPQALLQIYDNDAEPNPQFVIEQDGIGDVAMRFVLSPYATGRSFTLGINNLSLNAPFKISNSVTLGTRDVMILDDINCNITMGLDAGISLTVGADNTLIGCGSGSLVTDGSANTCIGRISTGGAGESLPASTDNTIMIGNSGASAIDGEIKIGNIVDHVGCSIAGIHNITPAGATETVIIDANGELGSTSSISLESLILSPTTALAIQINPFGAGVGETSEIRLLELAANGTNYTGFKAPDTLINDMIYTMPTADGSAGQTLQTDGSNILSWAQGIDSYAFTSIDDTDSPYTTLITDNMIGVDTSVAIVTVDLDTIANLGKKIYVIVDSAGNASTFNITINAGGADMINGAASVTIAGDFNSLTLWNDTSTNWFFI